MSNRLATRIGLPVAEERPADAFDLVAFEEPAVGALARTKGSIFVLAQLTGGTPALRRAAGEASLAYIAQHLCPSVCICGCHDARPRERGGYGGPDFLNQAAHFPDGRGGRPAFRAAPCSRSVNLDSR